ncbi:MAG TPA: hypothetical protein VMR28_01195, partial [Candidatus Saccharimonadales bacterium]|nr:hypothetical protein [Candidatus Saccharimonadales bacterium]
ANFNNIYLQSVAKMLLLNADPPIEQRGQYLAPVRLQRAAKWETLDPQAKVTIQELSNSTLEQFESVLSYTESQVDSIMGISPNAATGASAAYVNTVQAQAQQSMQDNQTTQFTNAIENYLRQYVLTALDLYISEQSGEGTIIIDDQAKDIINGLQPIDPATGVNTPIVGPNNEYNLNWDDFYDAIQTWTVDIDLSMGQKAANQQDVQTLQDELVTLRQNSNPNDPVAQANANKLEQVLIEKTAPEISNMPDPPNFAQPAPGGTSIPHAPVPQP